MTIEKPTQYEVTLAREQEEWALREIAHTAIHIVANTVTPLPDALVEAIRVWRLESARYRELWESYYKNADALSSRTGKNPRTQ